MIHSHWSIAAVLLVAGLLFPLVACAQPALQSRPTAEPELTVAQATEHEAAFLRNIQQITLEGTAGEGYFSADGTRIIYQAIRGEHPFYQIFIRDLITGGERMVSTGKGRTTCAFFRPDNRKIIFASSHLDPKQEEEVAKERARLAELARDPRKRTYAWAFDPWMEIFEADLDGSNLRRLTDAAGYDAEGAYSPDGKQIVFCSFRSGNGDLYIMDADGSNVRRLTDGDGYEGGPFFSPDGKKVIYRGEVPGKPELLQLMVINTDGTGHKQLTDNMAVNFGPYWHPGGNHVIFATSLHGHHNYELYLLNIHTGAQKRVTAMPGGDVLPVFSPGGSKLMWTSRRGKNEKGQDTSQLFLADWVFDVEGLK